MTDLGCREAVPLSKHILPFEDLVKSFSICGLTEAYVLYSGLCLYLYLYLVPTQNHPKEQIHCCTQYIKSAQTGI